VRAPSDLVTMFERAPSGFFRPFVSITVRLDPPAPEASAAERVLPARADAEFAQRGPALARVR
jgi:hypothetical protein